MEYSQPRRQEGVPAINDAESILERLAARHQFDELLATAKKICLEDSEVPLEWEAVRADAADTLGSFATSAVMTREAMHVTELPEYGNEFWGRSAAVDFLRCDTLLSQQRYDAEVADAIAAFGRQYLTEMYAVLGEDADEKVAQYRDSQQTEGDDTVLMTWLLERCKEIDDCGMRISSEVDIYTPIDLSPKLLGQYPDMQASPNCLSIDAMAIACLQRAGAEVYYSHLLQTRQEGQLAAVGLITSMLLQASSDMPPRLYNQMRTIFSDVVEEVTSYRGFHAGLVACMPSGAAYVVDPRGGYASPVQDRQYDMLRDKVEALNIQSKDFVVNQPSMCLYRTPFDIVRGLSVDEEVLYKFVAPSDECEKLRELVQLPGGVACIAQWAVEQLESSAFGQLINTQLQEEMDRIAGEPQTMVKAVERAIEAWIFDGFDEAEVQDLIATDPLIKQEMFDCIDAIMPAALVAVLVRMVRLDVGAGSGMLAQEMGNAEYGVGASVLHDVSVQLGKYMPPGFWAAHWASVVPHVELAAAYNRGEIEMSDAQLATTREALAWFSSIGPLPILSYSDIIKEFLAHTQQIES